MKKLLMVLMLLPLMAAAESFHFEYAGNGDGTVALTGVSGVVKVSDKGVAKLSCMDNGTKSAASGTLLPVEPDAPDGFAAYVSIKVSRTSFRAVKQLFVPMAEGWIVRAERWQ